LRKMLVPRATIFSPQRQYRYTLWREWDKANEKYVMFIGLNPSTADEVVDDPTIRRCVDFAKQWGFGALCMTNLFAYRARDPRDLIARPNPVGPDVLASARDAGMIVAAWGHHGGHLNRGRQVIDLLTDKDIYCLAITRKGQPRHPLYLRRSLKPFCYSKKKERKCRVCGCTEDRACPGGCYWVEPDLCSRCA